MAPPPWLLFSALSFSFILFCSEGLEGVQPVGRRHFPKGFFFGVGTSNYQDEGGVKDGGRGPSVSDLLAHTPGFVLDGSNADVANDLYHRYKEDVQLLKYLGVDAYRFSLSWSRIFPEGKGSKPNEDGIAYYNDLINNLLANGIEPHVTLHHLDHPQALEDSYKGFLGSQVIEDFVAYANVCFASFGDRVNQWMTFNEPHFFVTGAYISGMLPGYTRKANSSLDAYIAGHNLLLAHSSAVQLYRRNYQEKQKGSIGITMHSKWFVPLTDTLKDKESAKRALDFELGWFMDPIFFGEYPARMRNIVGDRLPKFSLEESRALRGSADFVGINHYTSVFTRKAPFNYKPEPSEIDPVGYFEDVSVEMGGNLSGQIIGPEVSGQFVAPWGFKLLLQYIRQRYSNPTLVIHENGIKDPTGMDSSIDQWRIDYLTEYLHALSSAIREGSNVRGYFVWSLLDNWLWKLGYLHRGGLYHVARHANLTRHPKASAVWYKKFLENPQPTISLMHQAQNMDYGNDKKI